MPGISLSDIARMQDEEEERREASEYKSPLMPTSLAYSAKARRWTKMTSTSGVFIT
jgi:hypothetical protein